MTGSVEVLEAPHTIDYTYTRSAGAVLGQFFTALRERRVLGARTSDGRVMVPPADYDPVTSDDLSELVEVADTGVVTTWSWNGTPAAGQPLDRPFAWALVRLDGADTAMLAAVDAGEAARMRTGMRVRARWAEQPTGTIRDLSCFEPEEQA